MKRSPAKAAPDAVTLSVRVQPRSSKEGIALMEDGSVKVKLTAPPVDGAANEALVKFLARTFDVSRSAVVIVSGQTGRQKVVRITGVGESSVRALLNRSSS